MMVHPYLIIGLFAFVLATLATLLSVKVDTRDKVMSLLEPP